MRCRARRSACPARPPRSPGQRGQVDRPRPASSSATAYPSASASTSRPFGVGVGRLAGGPVVVGDHVAGPVGRAADRVLGQRRERGDPDGQAQVGRGRAWPRPPPRRRPCPSSSASWPSRVLIEMPPVSKVMPLPTSTTCRCRAGRPPGQLDQPRRGGRAAADRQDAAEALGHEPARVRAPSRSDPGGSPPRPPPGLGEPGRVLGRGGGVGQVAGQLGGAGDGARLGQARGVRLGIVGEQRDRRRTGRARGRRGTGSRPARVPRPGRGPRSGTASAGSATWSCSSGPAARDTAAPAARQPLSSPVADRGDQTTLAGADRGRGSDLYRILALGGVGERRVRRPRRPPAGRRHRPGPPGWLDEPAVDARIVEHWRA